MVIQYYYFTFQAAKKESILDLNKYLETKVTVKFTGGREGN
jgi:hypothetical protein